MTGQERREKILAILEESGSVKSIEIAEEFGVSEKSIRRDLIEMEGKGLLIRFRGGAKRLDNHVAPAENMESKDAAGPVEQMETKDAAGPTEQMETKDAVGPVEQTKEKEVAQPVDPIKLEDIDISANQMKLELSEEPLKQPSKRPGSKVKVADESDNKSEQVSPGVVVKTSKPEWIVRAIEKARPGTIVEPVHPVVEKEETSVVQEKKKTPSVQEKKKTPSVQEKKKTPSVQEKKKTPSVQEKKKTPSVQEKKKTSPVQEKGGVLTTKAPESTPEEIEMGSTDEAKEPKKASKEINVIEVGETITPDVLEGLIKLVNPKAKEESELSSPPEEPVGHQEQTKEKQTKDKQKRDKVRRNKPVEDRLEKPLSKERANRIAKSAKPTRAGQAEESDRQKRPVRKARQDRIERANRQEGAVGSIKKNQKQKGSESKEPSKSRRIFDLIHIILALICFVGGTILAIYILQTSRNQNVEIQEDNGRHEMIICEELSVNSAVEEYTLVNDDTVIRVYF